LRRPRWERPQLAWSEIGGKAMLPPWSKGSIGAAEMKQAGAAVVDQPPQ
jgi:hypothetical protein